MKLLMFVFGVLTLIGFVWWHFLPIDHTYVPTGNWIADYIITPINAISVLGMTSVAVFDYGIDLLFPEDKDKDREEKQS